MMINKVLFISHKPKKCGVYEFGKNVFNAISPSGIYDFVKIECDSIAELQQAIATHNPGAIIYNYHPSVMPWLATRIAKGIYRNNIAGNRMIQIGIIHEITQEVADNATGYGNSFIIGASQKKLNSLFDYYIAADPTLLLKNLLVFKTGRLIPEYHNSVSLPTVTIIGSFGFGTPKKGFEKLVAKVQDEFSEATIRLNIPPADFGDSEGLNAKRIEDNCMNLIKNPKIKLDISHEFLNDSALLDFLAGNSMNAFMYEDTSARGLSSAVDNALAVGRPIAVSNCPMFRHILHVFPSIRVDELPLKQILDNGPAALNKISKDWNKENLLWEYERIISAVFKRSEQPRVKKGPLKRIRSAWKSAFSLPEQSFTWLRNTEAASGDSLTPEAGIKYKPVDLNGNGFNRILDDSARSLYKPAIEMLYRLAPVTMSKKIERANVQQAFIFDSVIRFLSEFKAPKLLCVGSYEDTASMGLQRMGYEVEEIDPMINYFLQDFFNKPSTKKNYYDIIFSTSVIEHDPDDRSFIECIENLLAVGGIAVITCDYKDGWRPGEPKPEVDARFYTKLDLEKRLPSYLLSSQLIDAPLWDCPNPDFNYLGKFQYTFATFVFKKKK